MAAPILHVCAYVFSEKGVSRFGSSLKAANHILPNYIRRAFICGVCVYSLQDGKSDMLITHGAHDAGVCVRLYPIKLPTWIFLLRV